MDPVQLYYLLQQQTFPIRILLRDGRSYDVPAREFTLVGDTYLRIGAQAANGPKGIWGPITTLQLQDIRSIEPAPTASSASSK